MWTALASSDGRSKADGVSGLRTGTGRSARPERAWIRHGRGSPSRSTAAGELGMLELEQEAAARLLDAAVLFGKPEAAASLAAHCREVPRTLRVWLKEDLVSFDVSPPLRGLSLKCPNVVAAAVQAGADVSLVSFSCTIYQPTLLQAALIGGHKELVRMMMRSGAALAPHWREGTGTQLC